MSLRRLALLASRHSTVRPMAAIANNYNYRKLHSSTHAFKSSLVPSWLARLSNTPSYASQTLFARTISVNLERGSDSIQKIGSNGEYNLVLDAKTHMLALYKEGSTEVVAHASFSYIREEQIALLSSVISNDQALKKPLLELLRNYLTETCGRADLICYEPSKDLSLVKNLDQSHYAENVMILTKRMDLSKIKVRPLEGLVSDKNILLKNLKLIQKFLIDNTYWAKNEGSTGLTEAMLENRIKESLFTLAIMDPNGSCRGFVSYFANQEFGYLYNMAIEESCRGRGYGKALLHNLLQLIPQDHVVSLISATEGLSVDAARIMYEQFGFRSLSNSPELRQLVVAVDIPQKRSMLLHNSQI